VTLVASLDVNGIIRTLGPGNKQSVEGFSVAATVTRSVRITPDDEETVDVVGTGSGVADAQGNFRLSIGGDGDPRPPITVTVSTPEGVQLDTVELSLEDAAKPVTLRVNGLPPLDIVPSGDPAKGGLITLTGRVLDEQGTAVAVGLPVVLWGVEAGEAEPRPLVVAQTRPAGFFSGDWVADTLTSAFGRVAGSAPVPIALDDANRLPRRVLLVLDVPDATPDGARPVVASPTDLTTNPAASRRTWGAGAST
jgi:hypothetical protein